MTDVDREMVFKMTAAIAAERALADEAADLFDRIAAAANDDGYVEAPEAIDIGAWLARYRKARQR
jgi:hypothetical protein